MRKSVEKERIRYEPGDAISGERLVFQCRKFNLNKMPTQGSSAHKSQTGTLDNAICVIKNKAQ